jgi:hypothetical protein
MGTLRQICMYCDTHYGNKDSQGTISGDSHGICPGCAEKSQKELDAIADAKNAARRKSFSDFIK